MSFNGGDCGLRYCCDCLKKERYQQFESLYTFMLPCNHHVCKYCLLQIESFKCDYENCARLQEVHANKKANASSNLIKQSSFGQCSIEQLLKNKVKLVEFKQETGDQFNVIAEKSDSLIDVVENKFEYLSSEIELRIESIKIDIDNINKRMNDNLDQICKNLKDSMNRRKNKRRKNKRLTTTNRIPNSNNNKVKTKPHSILFHLVDQLPSLSNVGELNNPYFRYDSLKSIKSLHTPSYHLSAMCYMPNKNQICVLDTIEISLKLFDLDGQFLNSVYLRSILERPKCMCVNKKGELVIASDAPISKLHVMNDDSFEMMRTIHELVCMPCSIAYDSKTGHVYICSSFRRNIVVLDFESGRFVNKCHLFAPEYIKLRGDYLYVNEDKKLLVLDKQSLEIKKSINVKFDFKYFDIINDFHIITVNEICVGNNLYDNRLNIIDFNGNCVLEMKLSGLKNKINDMLVLGKKIFFNTGYYDPALHLVEFC